MVYILIFDLPRNKASVRVKVNRLLHRIDAEKVQQSVWMHENYEWLKEAKEIIVSSGGSAILLKGEVIE